MPELPDLVQLKGYFDSTSLHQRIRSVQVRDGRILERINPAELHDSLVDSNFTETMRRGKYLFISACNEGSGIFLVLHFGMTGKLRYYKENGGEPEYVKVLFRFENNYSLAYICPRMLGKVSLTESADRYISDTGLGPDAMEISFDQFAELLKKGRGTVKSALMNQKFLSGLGNIYTDEILFQAGVDPETGKGNLSEGRIEKIYHTMGRVLETAIEHQADPEKLPEDFIIPRRNKGETCPVCGTGLERKKIGGRSTYFCPRCQK